MKNFDEERKVREEETREEREFVLGGETFYAKASVRPEIMLAFEQINKETPPSEVLAIADQLVTDMLDPENESHDRYRALRQTDAVDMATLLEICNWLIEAVTGRPTEQPAVSSPLPATPESGTPSTDDSSSEDSTAG